MKPRLWALVLLLVGAAASLPWLVPASQASSASQDTRAETPVAGDALVVGVSADADSLLPLYYKSIAGATVVDLTCPSLVQSRFKEGQIEYVPSLAQAWRWSEDRKTLTFQLRGDVRWDDGQPVGVEDVVLSYGLLRDPAVGAFRANLTEFLVPGAEAITSTAAGEVQFRFRTAYDATLQLAHAGHALMPAHRLRDADRKALREHPLVKQPVGAGAFRVQSWTPGQELILAASPAGNGSRVPWLRKVLVRVVADPQAQLAQLLQGSLDLVEIQSPKDLDAVRKNQRLRVLQRGRRGVEYLAWNVKDPLLADKRVRRALTLAIDRVTLTKALLADGTGQVHGALAEFTISPELALAGQLGLPPMPFAPDESRRLLDAAGFVPGPDGIRVRDGRRLSFQLHVSANSERRKAGAVLIQGALKAVGVELAVEPLEYNTMMSRVLRKEFQAAYLGSLVPLYLDQRAMWRTGGSQNAPGYSDPEVDRVVEEALLETDPAKSVERYRELARRVAEDQPCTFLYWFDQLAVIDRRFRGVRTSPMSLLHAVDEWWVPVAEQKYR